MWLITETMNLSYNVTCSCDLFMWLENVTCERDLWMWLANLTCECDLRMWLENVTQECDLWRWLANVTCEGDSRMWFKNVTRECDVWMWLENVTCKCDFWISLINVMWMYITVSANTVTQDCSIDTLTGDCSIDTLTGDCCHWHIDEGLFQLTQHCPSWYTNTGLFQVIHWTRTALLQLFSESWEYHLNTHCIPLLLPKLTCDPESAGQASTLSQLRVSVWVNNCGSYCKSTNFGGYKI